MVFAGGLFESLEVVKTSVTCAVLAFAFLLYLLHTSQRKQKQNPRHEQ
ncbi:MAG: hypothetical protein [Siphoviridae sp. ctjeG17]|nr:MAG: hypothetical protein [Siphoviridae sp. ctjeG17]